MADMKQIIDHVRDLLEKGNPPYSWRLYESESRFKTIVFGNHLSVCFAANAQILNVHNLAQLEKHVVPFLFSVSDILSFCESENKSVVIIPEFYPYSNRKIDVTIRCNKTHLNLESSIMYTSQFKTISDLEVFLATKRLEGMT